MLNVTLGGLAFAFVGFPGALALLDFPGCLQRRFRRDCEQADERALGASLAILTGSP
jgi:hypothetical protein